MKSKSRLAIALAAVWLSGSAYASDWERILGTVPSGVAAPVNVFGFIQPTYFDTGGSTVQGLKGPAAIFNGEAPNFNLVAPDHSSSSSFNLLRARLAVRGTLSPISNNIDYFVMAEFGNNGFTYSNGQQVPRLIYANVTFNQLPFAHVQVGAMKTPGDLELLQGIANFTYVNFTNVTQQLMLNDYVSGEAISNGAGGYFVNPAGNNGAADTGIQLFDWFNNGPWVFSYAGMISDDSTLYNNANTGLPSYYGNLQEAYVLNHSKEGPHQAAISGWIWDQVKHEGLQSENGVTNPTTGAFTPTGGYTNQTYTYKRYGLGAQIRTGFMRPGAFRITGEWMRGTGWIIAPAAFGSPLGGLPAGGVCGAPTAGSTVTPNALCTETLYAGGNNAATGWYLESGVFVSKHLSVEARYDQYNRLTNSPQNERIFKTVTLGLNYYFKPSARVTLNYDINRLDVPYPQAGAAGSNAEAVTTSEDNVISVQTTIMF